MKQCLAFIFFLCATNGLFAALIFRSNPEPGTFSLGALRDLSVGIWFDGENVRTVTFDLNGTRIVRSSSTRNGFLDVSFSGNVWSWGKNKVYVTFQDAGGGVLSREVLTYQIVMPFTQSQATPVLSQSASPQGGESPVGTWVRRYTAGSSAAGNRISAKVTLAFRSDGSGTVTAITAGYADPQKRYGSDPGIGEWTAVTNARFRWEKLGENQILTTGTGGQVTGETRFMTPESFPQVGEQVTFNISGANLTTTFGTWKRGGD